jgi:membrane fusion protein, heavy metal efflux system
VGRVEEHLQHLGLSSEGAMEEYSEARERRAGKFEQSELIPVVAPLSGTVLKRMVSPGTVVTPSNDLFVVSDLSSLWVNAEVPEKYLAKLKLGLHVMIHVQAYGNEPFQARISQIGDTLDPDTRTVQVRCQTDNKSQKLKPEMYANIGFDLGGQQETTAIPSAALQEINGTTVVFLQEAETRFRLRNVRVGRQVEPLSEILEGLKPGEKVVSVGSFLLKSEVLKKQMTEE